MSAILEWSVPFTLTSPQGSIDFNVVDENGFLYLLIPDECDDDQAIIALKQKISGGDGEIFSRRSKPGYVARLSLYMMKGGAFAIGADLVSMWNTLLLHLNALENPPLPALGGGTCRLQWTPSGSSDDWMLDRLRTLEKPKPSGVYPKKTVFTVDTELPYAMRATQTTTALADGVTSTLDNSDGTTNFLPVFKVYGASSSFLIVNSAALDSNGNPLQISYLGAALPGGASIAGGDYVEITCPRETVVLNGDEDFGSIAGIDIPNSELRLPIVPGDNPLTITGADADVLWQPARA